MASGPEVSWLLQEGLKKSAEEYSKLLSKIDLSKLSRR